MLQFLHPLRQRQVQPLRQSGEPGLRVLVLALRYVQCTFQCGELAAQRSDLLVEHLDLRQHPRAPVFFSSIELGGQIGYPALGVAGAGADALVKPAEAVALGFRWSARLALQLRELLLEARASRPSPSTGAR